MKFLQMMSSITKEACCIVKYTVVSSIHGVATFVAVLLPYGMYILGQYAAIGRGYIGSGAELLIPIVVSIVVYYMREIGNRSNKGSKVPMPAKRFTSLDEYGEVSIEQDRLNELILYVADLEDWMAKRGML